jgi:hypothetical protein
MIQVTMAAYTLTLAKSVPERDDVRCAHATVVERFGSELGGRSCGELHVEVRRGSDPWPFLCVAQHYAPGRWAGSHPGLLLVPETSVLFIGAGERLLAYDLQGPARLWEDTADTGFHKWQRHDDMVVMSAELELAAWDIHGVKRWSCFVEPPWEYHVATGRVELDVMGTLSAFPLQAGLNRP